MKVIKVKIKRLYLSGPMTGIKNLNKPAFSRGAKSLRAKGFTVVNPPELDYKDPQRTWEGCLRRDLKSLVTCDAIATLPRWTKSRGANLEIHVGRSLSMPVHTVGYYLKKRRK